MRHAVWRLDELQPAWEGRGSGWGQGVSFACPTHGGHRLTVFFVNGVDGYLQVSTYPLFWRLGASFSTLTLVEPVELGGCFSGWIEGGWLLVRGELH